MKCIRDFCHGLGQVVYRYIKGWRSVKVSAGLQVSHRTLSFMNLSVFACACSPSGERETSEALHDV